MKALLVVFTSPGAEIIRLGPFSLRWYGLLIAIAVFLGLNLSSHLAKQRGIENGLINDLLPILVLSAVIGARAYYVIFEWENYKSNWLEVFAIWRGGIAIHGALIAGSISILIFSKIKGQSFWNILDVIFPSVALGQAIGRWGNFFNNEAFGLPTELPWKLSIPYINRPTEFANIQYFHPTFLYESIWNLAVFTLLILLFSKWKKGVLKLPNGALTCFYLISYSLGRFWIEGLRTDPLCLTGIPPFCEGGIRVAQVVSLLLISMGIIGLWWIYIRKRNLPEMSKGTRSTK